MLLCCHKFKTSISCSKAVSTHRNGAEICFRRLERQATDRSDYFPKDGGPGLEACGVFVPRPGMELPCSGGAES